MKAHIAPRVSMALALLVAALFPAEAMPQEAPGTFTPGLFPLHGLDQPVQVALVAHDPVLGRGLIVGGGFTRAEAASANRIAFFDAARFVPLGEGLSGDSYAVVSALAEFDDGSGPALYAGGRFDRAGRVAAGNVARWDGRKWSALAAGAGPLVVDFAAFDDGSGPALFAAGSIRSGSGDVSNGVFRWTGAEWEPHALGFSATDLDVFDDGFGAGLYAAAVIQTSGAPRRHAVLRCERGSYTIVGDDFDGAVRGLAVFDDGDGDALFAVGGFTANGVVPLSRAARWSGLAWSALGSGLDGEASCVASAADERGAALFVGGRFSMAGGRPASRAARWDGVGWSPLGAGIDPGAGGTVIAIAGFDGGGGPAVYFGGGFKRADGARVSGLARYDRGAWSAPVDALDGAVRAFLTHDEGSGPSLYVGGEFERCGRTVLNGVARWTGTRFEPVGDGVGGSVDALEAHDDGDGVRLYVGGRFSLPGSPMANIARFDGAAWVPVFGGTNDRVRALASLGDPTNPTLYVGGDFTYAGGVGTGALASLKRYGWVGLHGGPTGRVHALEFFDDGIRRILVVGGAVAGEPLGRLVDGWLRPIPGLAYGSVYALHRIVDRRLGSGVLVGGGLAFEGADRSHHRVALFDGAEVVPFAPESEAEEGYFTCFAEMDDGSAPALFAGGFFRRAGRFDSHSIARFDGTQWGRLEGGSECCASLVSALAVRNDGAFPSLVAGGDFVTMGGRTSSYMAEWMPLVSASRRGSVDAGAGPPADVLFVNDSAFRPSRAALLLTHQPITVFVASPPAARGKAPFALYAYEGTPAPGEESWQPFGIGLACAPTPLDGDRAAPVAIWNNTGRSPAGAPTHGSSPAPSVVFRWPLGSRRPVSFFLQGIIFDPASAARRPASVTNAILVQTR